MLCSESSCNVLNKNEKKKECSLEFFLKLLKNKKKLLSSANTVIRCTESMPLDK